jgi:hypothetical protein
MTTAERMAVGLADGLDALEEELTIAVKVILRNEMVKILSNGFTARTNPPS